MLATIEDIREKLYGVLQDLGRGSHDRLSIARKLKKHYLNPVDVAALDMLVADGRVEKSIQQIVTTGRGSNLTKVVYRIKEQARDK